MPGNVLAFDVWRFPGSAWACTPYGPAPDRLIACLGNLIVFRWVPFARNAREAGVPGYGRADDPDWRATMTPDTSHVRLKRRLHPLGYVVRGLPTIAREVQANIVAQFYWHETHGLMRLAF